MSFDPDLVAALRRQAPGLMRGIVAQRRYADTEWAALPRARRRQMAWFTHAARTRPQFLAYAVNDLPALAPFMARRLFGLPLLTWTVRNADGARRAAAYADQIIFEGFRP